MIDLKHLHVEEYPDSLGPDVKHFRVFDETTTVNRGFGSANSSELALYKAVSEYYERLTLSSQKDWISSNGFAAHVNDEKAIQAAICELVERDVVMCSWLTKQTPLWLEEKDLPPDFKVFSDAGLNCQVGLLGRLGNIQVYISTLRPKNEKQFGMMYTSAASVGESAIESIYYNQRRNYTYFKTNLDNGSLSFCKDLEAKDPDDHRRFYLNPASVKNCGWLFAQGTSTIGELPKIQTSILQIPVQTPWKLSVARAESEFLQGYFIGLPKMQELNLSRIYKYRPESNHQLNTALHPLP